MKYTRIDNSFWYKWWVAVIFLLYPVWGNAHGSLPDSIEASRYFYRWFPVNPIDAVSNKCSLMAGETIECEIPGQSALKITGIPDPSTVTIQQVCYTGYGTQASSVRIPVSGTWQDNSVELPTDPGSGTTFAITAQADLDGLACYRLIRYAAGQYWRNIYSDVAQQIRDGEAIMDGVTVTEPYHYMGLWCTQLQNILNLNRDGDLQNTHTVDPIQAQLIYELILSGRLMDREDTETTSLDLKGSALRLDQVEGVIRSGDIDISVEGPGLIDLDLRWVWPENSAETRGDVPFRITVDDIPLGADHVTVGLDAGSRRWIPRSVPHLFELPDRVENDIIETPATRVSLSHPLTIYIPSGTHSLKLITSESYWIACEFTQPKHNWPSMTGSADSSGTIIKDAFASYPDTMEDLCTLGMSLLPEDLLGDIGWLKTQFEPDHVLINRAYQHQRNIMVWEPVEGDDRVRWFLDPPDPILEIRQEGLSDSSATMYPVPSQREAVVDVAGHEAWVPVLFYDLEYTSNGDPLELEIDGRSRIIKEQVGTQRFTARYSLAMTPGQHTIRLKTMDRSVFCSMPIQGVDGITQYLRAYTQLPMSSDRTFTTTCDGGPHGRELRLIWRPSPSGVRNSSLFVSLDHSDPFPIVCSVTEEISWGAGCVIDIPPGVHSLAISTNDVSGSYINLSLSRSDQMNQNQEGVSDGELIHVEQYATVREFPVESGLRLESFPVQQQILILADHGDCGSAWQLLRENALSSRAVSTRILIGYLQWKSGYPNSAVRIWTGIETETGQQWDWLNHWIMNAAMAAQNPYEAWKRSVSILKKDPVNVSAHLIQGRCLLHFGQPESAEQSLNGIQLNSNTSGPNPVESGECIDQLREMIARYDPAAGFPDDWAFFSSNPDFVTVHPFELTGGGIATALITQENSLRSISDDLNDGDSKDHMLIREGEEIQYVLQGPTQIKILARPGHILQDGISPMFSFDVSIGDKTMGFSFPRNQEDGQDRVFTGFEAIRPGLPEQVLIPILADEAIVSIRCTSGLGAILLKYQIPGIDDHPGSSLDHEMVSQYLMALSLLNNDHSDGLTHEVDALRSFALVQSILCSHPRCEPAEKLSEYLSERVNWKWLDSWTEMDSQHLEVQRIKTTETHHDPIVSIRGALLDPPNPEVPDHILTTRQTLRFDLSGVHSRTVQCRLSNAFLSDQRYRVRIRCGNRLMGELGPDQRELSVRLPPENKQDLRFDLECESDSQLVRLAVWPAENASQGLPVVTVRSFQVLNPDGELQMPVFGPTVIRVESRLWHSNKRRLPDETSFRVTVRDGAHQILTEQIVTCLWTPDPDAGFEDGMGEVGLPVVQDLPLPEYQKYIVQLTPIKQTGLPVLVRLTAATYRKTDSVNHVKESFIRLDKLQSESSSQPIVPEPSKQEWNSPVPRHLGIQNQSGGTWKMDGVVRNRDNNPDIDGDFYSSDGYSLLVGYQRRFEGKGLYFDGDIGITHPTDEPDDPMVSLNQIWNLNTVFYDLRSQLVINGRFQEIQDQMEHSREIRFSMMRSFHPTLRWSLIPSLSAFYIGQSLSPEEVAGLDTLPEPGIFNTFDNEYDSGMIAETTVRHEPVNWLTWHLGGKTITAGSHESSVMGPWWMETGLRGVIGPVVWGVSYTRRSTFSESMTPDRTRITGSVTLFQWMGDSLLWEVQIWDRFTTETDWNEFQVAVRVRWNTGRLLRDRDPNRIEFKDHIENLYRLSSEGDYDRK